MNHTFIRSVMLTYGTRLTCIGCSIIICSVLFACQHKETSINDSSTINESQTNTEKERNARNDENLERSNQNDDNTPTTATNNNAVNDTEEIDLSEPNTEKAIHSTRDDEEKTDPESNTEQNNPVRYRVNATHYMIEPVNTEPDHPIALLTFDDGPRGDITFEILDLLDEYDAKAIFFVMGYSAEQHPEALSEIHDRGHIIGNHTWTHANIGQAGDDTVRDAIVPLNDFIEEVTGTRPSYFRAPYGANPPSTSVLIEEDMQPMNWSNGSLDWEYNNSEAVTDQVLENMTNGDNILFHELEHTVEALDEILATLTEKGYAFVLPTEVDVPEMD